jgi:hypothetical protein
MNEGIGGSCLNCVCVDVSNVAGAGAGSVIFLCFLCVLIKCCCCKRKPNN